MGELVPKLKIWSCAEKKGEKTHKIRFVADVPKTEKNELSRMSQSEVCFSSTFLTIVSLKHSTKCKCVKTWINLTAPSHSFLLVKWAYIKEFSKSVFYGLQVHANLKRMCVFLRWPLNHVESCVVEQISFEKEETLRTISNLRRPSLFFKFRKTNEA